MKTSLYFLIFLFIPLSVYTQEQRVSNEIKPDSVNSSAMSKETTVKQQSEKFQLTAGRKVSLNGLLQLRYLSQLEENKPDGFDVRRARLDFKTKINEQWDSRLQLELAGNIRIMDAILNYKHADWLKFSVGQFYIPFSLESTTSDSKLELLDRSQVVESLVARSRDVIGNQNGRDIGIQASGNLFKNKNDFFITYYVGVFNGAGINVMDNNESKDFSGRLVFRPLNNLSIGISYYNGFDRWGSPALNHVRDMYGTELNYSYKIFHFSGEYIGGLNDIIHEQGYYAQLGAFVYRKKLQMVGRYDFYDLNTDMSNNTSFSNYTVGLNLYMNEWIKLQVNYTKRIEELQHINNDLIAIQIQLEF